MRLACGIAAMMRLGLISDTHGLLRPEAVAFLRGSNCILHAGDIGPAGILEQLGDIAPVTAVRGNNDRDSWADALASAQTLCIAGLSVHLLHDLAELDIDPAGAGVRIVVHGHSHRARVVERDGVLYVNPGSAGPRRFRLPVSVGELLIDGAQVAPRVVDIA